MAGTKQLPANVNSRQQKGTHAILLDSSLLCSRNKGLFIHQIFLSTHSMPGIVLASQLHKILAFMELTF